MKLSIVVPCYNESGNIPLIISRFREILPESLAVEVLLVNNGSTDNSQEVFDQQLAQQPDDKIRVVNVVQNKGYGYGILSGLDEAKGEVLAWTHADMQTDPQDVIVGYHKFIEEAENNYLIVKGARKKRKITEAFFSWGMQVISSLVLNTGLTEINAQPKVFKKSFYDEIKEDAPYDFSLDLYLLYMGKKKGRIIEFPVFFNKRMHGEAKGGGSFKTRIKLIKRTFKYIFELGRTLK